MIRGLVDGLVAVVIAPTCAACGEPLDTPTQSPVCRRCWASIRLLTPPFCQVCGDPVLSRASPASGAERCARCRQRPTHIARGRAIGEYDGTLRAILHALKYDGRKSLARPLSALMRIHCNDVLGGADMVVPVPLHWRRQWRRGFNQAAELAAGLGLPMVRALRRRRHTRSQADLPAGERQANVRDAFKVARRRSLVGACVVVVDDVSTTGATLEACARALTEAGVREVRAVTAARVVTRFPDERRTGRPLSADHPAPATNAAGGPGRDSSL
jgi:ComF family protein